MNNNRSGNVDLARFISALIIMTFHLNVIYGWDYPFQGGWIYVEFFLIITGYYTAKHFDNKNFNNPMKESIIYTLKKFVTFLPYTTITTILKYLFIYKTGEMNIIDFFCSFIDNFTFDILLVIESYDKPLVGTLWYLSALLIVFPLFSWLMQIRNRYWIMIFSFFYSLLYYGAAGVYGNRDYPQDLLRVMAGLCMGAFVYEVIYAFGDYLKRINKALLTIIEVITFLIPILLTYKNVNSFRFIIVCYIVCCAIMLPKLSYTSKIKGKVFIYLGQLSMPIFVIHWLVGEVVNHYVLNNSIALYYGGG